MKSDRRWWDDGRYEAECRALKDRSPGDPLVLVRIRPHVETSPFDGFSIADAQAALRDVWPW